jgi:hypothetical protein
MQLNLRDVQKPCIVANSLLPAVLMWVVYCAGCGCPEFYLPSVESSRDATDILISIDQTGYPDQWENSPRVGLVYEPPQDNRAYVTFTVQNLACQDGRVSISLGFRVGEARVRSYHITWSPYDCPGLDANYFDVTDADIQCEIASSWDKENLVMSISIEHCEIDVLDINYWGEGNSPSIQHISIHFTHTFQMGRGGCR